MSDHFGIIDADCIMRAIEVIDRRAYNGLLPHNQSSQSSPYYFRQTYNCLKKELSVCSATPIQFHLLIYRVALKPKYYEGLQDLIAGDEYGCK